VEPPAFHKVCEDIQAILFVVARGGMTSTYVTRYRTSGRDSGVPMTRVRNAIPKSLDDERNKSLGVFCGSNDTEISTSGSFFLKMISLVHLRMQTSNATGHAKVKTLNSVSRIHS